MKARHPAAARRAKRQLPAADHEQVAAKLGRLPLGPVSPFLGAGVGASIELEGQDDQALTLHAVLGVNVAVSRRIETVTEARIRSIDPWTGNTVDLLIGLGWRF